MSHICVNIIKNIYYQLFLDDKLNYEQQVYLLNHHNCIETVFIAKIINNFIELILNDHTRQSYLHNINRLNWFLLDILEDSHIHIDRFLNNINNNNNNNNNLDNNYDDDEDDSENYLEDFNDNESDYDDYNDLENLILDDLEIEYYVNNYYYNINNSESDLNDHHYHYHN